MTREEGITALHARTDGDRYRWLELLKKGTLATVVIEHVDRPEWRLTGRSWAEVLRALDNGWK